MPRNPVKKYVTDIVAKHDPGSMIIDVGAGEDPNYYEAIFAGKTFHKLDMVQNKAKTIRIVTDMYCLPPALLGQYTTALLLETLEHVPYPPDAVQATASLLAPGGLLILSTVCCWGIHHHPKDYWRMLPDGIELLIKDAGLQKIDITLEKANTTTPGGVFAAARKP